MKLINALAALATLSIITTGVTATESIETIESIDHPLKKIWDHIKNYDPSFACYPFGENYTVGTATHHVERFCHGDYLNLNAGADSSPHGRFKPGEVKQSCADTFGDVRYEMSLKYLPSSGEYGQMQDEECIFRFGQLIQHCLQTGGTGGYNTREEWEFHLDPNAGKCSKVAKVVVAPAPPHRENFQPDKDMIKDVEGGNSTILTIV